jgi:hypothetical protein
MKKIKVLILNEPENINGVTWWRQYRPLLYLESMYGDSLEIMWNRGVMLPVDLLRCDIAIAWRPCLPNHVAVLEYLHAKGIPIIVDYDDDVVNVPTGSKAYDTLSQTIPGVQRCIEMATQVWVSTSTMVKVYGVPHKTHIIPNAIDVNDIPTAPTPLDAKGKAHIVWRGDSFQAEDVLAHMHWYKNLVKSAYMFTWYGYMPTHNTPPNVVYLKWESLEGYFRTMKLINVNYVWKPMRRDIPFNFSKSGIAGLEALCAGGVPLTNFTGADDVAWRYATDDLLRDETKLHGLWEQNRDHAIINYNLEDWTHRRMQLISDAAGR